MEQPVAYWVPSIAPSGMAFYGGEAFPEWRGDLFLGALAHRHLRRLELEGNEVVGQEELLAGLGERIRDVRSGPDGFLYVLTDSDAGRLLRLEPAGPEGAAHRREIGRAHVWNPVTNAHLVCRLLLEKNKRSKQNIT